MVNIKWLIFLICNLCLICFPKTEFEISSSVSKSRLFSNEVIILSLTINGAEKDIYKDIQQPDLSKSFNIISSSQSSSFSFINGVVNRKKEFRYSIQPKKAGIFIIDPFSITYEGTSYSTKPIRIVVKKGTVKTPQLNKIPSPKTQQPLSSSQRQKNIFLETKISTTNIFIGENIYYSVKLFRRVSLWSTISINQNDINNVWQENNPPSKERVVNRNGQRYYELELVNKILRPLSTGNITIPPLTARFVVDPFSGEYQLSSKPIAVTINQLPEPIPSSFTGAIGTYAINLKIPVLTTPTSALQIQLNISGLGNLSEIKPPVIEDTDKFRVLLAPKETSSNNKHQLFDYVILPKVTGTIVIDPIQFSYFSKLKLDYILLETSPITFNAIVNETVLSPSSFQEKKDIHFLEKNTPLIKAIEILNTKKYQQFLILANVLLLLLFAIKLAKKRISLRKKTSKTNKKILLRHIEQLSEESSIQEMSDLLTQTISYYTKYTDTTINSRNLKHALNTSSFSEPLIKSILQWVNNVQSIQYSNEKSEQINHSNAESLKRILKNIMKESQKK